MRVTSSHNEIDFSIELAKIGGKIAKFGNEEDAKSFLASHDLDETSLKKEKNKKGNVLYSATHREKFTLNDVEKKESKRTP
jgi:spore coat protein CotH